MAQILESIMLICFGLSWPVNALKNFRARSAKNMSLPFIMLILVGYIAGILAKILSKQFNYVLVIYFINLFFVSINLAVFFRNRTLDMKAGKK